MYALVDCNNFFASCERVFRPDLEGRPVVVMSGNDGCSVARSNEAKALGIKMGTPLFQIRDLVERENVQCFSSNFSLYGDLSSRVMSLLGKHTDLLQQYSIDEAFLRIDHIPKENYRTYFQQVVLQIRRGVGIPVSIGIAPTKTLAKIASKYAKQYPGYRGVCLILTDEQRLKALSTFPVDDVWGIGRRVHKRLDFQGITTAADLAAKPREWIENFFTKPGIQTWLELRGEDVIQLSELPEKRSITVSRTFAHPLLDQKELEAQLCDFLSSCCRKLRNQHSACAQFIVFACTSRFADGGSHYCSSVVTMPVPTANLQELLNALLSAFRIQYRRGFAYKRGGVIITQLLPDANVQADLFDARDRSRDARLQSALDSLNNRFGKGQVRFCAQSPSASTYNLDHLSPRYSTRIDEIITVK